MELININALHHRNIIEYGHMLIYNLSNRNNRNYQGCYSYLNTHKRTLTASVSAGDFELKYRYANINNTDDSIL